MDATYHQHGFEFRYPGFWELSEHSGQDGEWTITVSSPGTSFWSLSLYSDRPRPEALIDSAVSAFREEYPDLDVYPLQARLCDRPAVARDLEFLCFDLVNGASVRAVQIGPVTAFVLYQGTDDELESTRPILEAITASLSYDPSRDSGLEGERA
ncbi:MAG TPA: hypothetical protein VML55_07530 [Planctomycetaceae bacterium]|nr:hypothetical protein [Planctomycetaceae bacterium]